MTFEVRRISGIKGRKSAAHKKSESLKEKIKRFLKYFGIAVVTIALMSAVYFAEQSGMWFKASILEAPQPFNGTALPISKVPSFKYWSSNKNLHYNQIDKNELVDIPSYDLSQLQFPTNQLEWGNSNHDGIRTAKIAYSVVYMGNYEFDHIEDHGSHPAVDIKVPVGTPIHSIANGKVVKADTGSGGFGHHIVIKHPNVPDPDNPGKLTTLYSAYAHMDEVHVSEGQNVSKGEVIGTSGNTGTTTTPHLHLQIDRDSAPWHPYWPFTWQESQAAGLSFFEAINAGLGMSNGKKNTVNPMKFIYNNLNTSAIVTNEVNATAPSPEEPEVNEVVVVEEVVDTPKEIVTDVNIQPPAEVVSEVKEGSSSALFDFHLSGEKVSLLNNGVTIIVEDQKGQVQKLSDSDRIKVEISGVGSLLKKELTKADFNNHTAKIIVRSSEAGIANVSIGRSSHQVHFIDGVKPVHHYEVEHDGYFQLGVVETVRIIAMDEEGNIAPTINFPGYTNLSVTEGAASLDPVQLQAHQFNAGVAEIKVVSNQKNPIKIKAQNGALVGTSDWMRVEEKFVFDDVDRNHDNYLAIKYLKDQNILSGYNDGAFRPNQTVNRVEALKMLMLAFNIKAESGGTVSFTDTESNAWYVPTLSTAVKKGIVKGYDDGTFKPANTVNKAEYLKILFETNGIETNIEITKPYLDVETNMWFAKYAFLANRMNLLKSSTRLYPDQFMTRAEVAETIYRMKMIQEHNMVTYSK